MTKTRRHEVKREGQPQQAAAPFIPQRSLMSAAVKVAMAFPTTLIDRYERDPGRGWRAIVGKG